MSTVPLYHLSGYTFGVKDAQPDEDVTMPARLNRLQAEYEETGMRVTVEGLMLVHDHGHPHVLLLQTGTSFHRLPGDQLRPGEDEIEGLKLRINQRLGPSTKDAAASAASDFEVGELLGVWWRPNFEAFMYPYLPAHIKFIIHLAQRPKEVKKIYLIHLPEKKMLSVPKNMKLLAVPLFELYENAGRYGQQLASLSIQLSRFTFLCQ
eukprot:jgi/Hompol1/75/HPOL_004285-RA